MLDYQRSIDATLSFDGVSELVRLAQDSDLGSGLGEFSIYRNGFLTQTGFGPLGLGVTYDRTFYSDGGLIVRNLAGFANEDTETNFNLDGSYTFHRVVDVGITEDLTVKADGSGERVVVDSPFGDPVDPVVTDYAPGTFDVAPLQPQVEATTRLQYKFDGDGDPISLRIANEDGGYTVAQYNDSPGSRIPERHLTYDAAGKPVEEDRFDANGTLTYSDHVNADGSHTTTAYALTGIDYEGVQRTSTTTYFADGSSISEAFRRVPDGFQTREELVSTTRVSADGTKVKDFDLADGHHTNTYLGGKLALGELIRMDGSKEAIVFQANVSVDDTSGNDVFTAFGKDTFVFGQGGDDIVRNFHATGPLADTIRLVGVEAEDVSISMAGRDTVIHLDDDASITVTGVRMADVVDHILFA